MLELIGWMLLGLLVCTVIVAIVAGLLSGGPGQMTTWEEEHDGARVMIYSWKSRKEIEEMRKHLDLNDPPQGSSGMPRD